MSMSIPRRYGRSRFLHLWLASYLSLAIATEPGLDLESSQGIQILENISYHNRSGRLLNGQDGIIRFVNGSDIKTEMGIIRFGDPVKKNTEHMPDLHLEKILVQVLIFICGTVGVLCLCCICCSQIISRLSIYQELELQRRIINSYERIHRDAEAGVRFIPMHHHPWSPGILDIPQEELAFNYNENNDKPPSYDELGSNVETPCSPPPPPYTPSFQQTDSTDLTHGDGHVGAMRSNV